MVTAIILAAGRGERLRSRVSKPLVKLAGKPLLCHSLETLAGCSQVTSIILVVNQHNRRAVELLVKKNRYTKVCAVVPGGARRQDSVQQALDRLPQACVPSSLVLVHDAARPFISGKVLSHLLHAARKFSAAIPAVPVKATVKEVESRLGRCQVKKTADRSVLWEVQTPQVFGKNLILEAYRRFGRQDVTDDAALVEKLGVAVQVVAGSYAQIKVTTPEDMIIAEAIAAHRGQFGL